MLLLLGAWCGATLAGVLCIAYNTSANVSELEGGHEHMTFGYVAILMAGGAAVGLLVAAVAVALASVRVAPQPPE